MRRVGKERLETCHRCQKNNTYKLIASSDEGSSSLIYCAWCRECQAPYSYMMGIIDVIDQKGRI